MQCSFLAFSCFNKWDKTCVCLSLILVVSVMVEGVLEITKAGLHAAPVRSHMSG